MDALSLTPQLNAALPVLSVVNAAAIDKTAEDFEAVFATQLLQPMFEGVGVNATFGGGHGEEVMRSFLLQEYGKILAKGDRLGVAKQIKTVMLRAQEDAASSAGASPRRADRAYGEASQLSASGDAHAVTH